MSLTTCHDTYIKLIRKVRQETKQAVLVCNIIPATVITTSGNFKTVTCLQSENKAQQVMYVKLIEVTWQTMLLI